MAQNLAEAEGIVLDNAYPKGAKIVDNQTTVNAHINQDIIQFFQKLMKEGNVTPNELDDNETNGYQFIEAFKKALKFIPSAKETGFLATDTDAGLVELATNQETIDGTDGANHSGITYPLCVSPSRLTNYTDRVRIKAIQVTGWNMHTTGLKVVEHGIGWSGAINLASYKVLATKVVVITQVDDLPDRNLYDMGNDLLNPSAQGWIGVIDNTYITLLRKTGGIFDDEVHYDGYFSTVWVFITYIP